MQKASLPKISVVIPVRNGARTLPKALASVFMQTYQPYEIVVIDGMSTDTTVELLKNYGDRVRWISEPDSGISEALNKGFGMALGDYITVLLADDFFYDAGVFKRASDRLVADPSIDMLFGTIRRIDPEGLAPTKDFESRVEDLPKRTALHLEGTFFKHAALVGAELDPRYKIANDYEFLCRQVFECGLKVATMPEINMVLHLGGTSSDVRNDFRHSYEKFLVRRKYFGLILALRFAAGAYLISALRKAHFRPFTWYRKTKRFLKLMVSHV